MKKEDGFAAAQGKYLTRCPEELLELLNRACVKYSGEPLPYYPIAEEEEQELIEERRRQILKEIGEISEQLKMKIVEEKIREFKEIAPERIERKTSY